MFRFEKLNINNIHLLPALFENAFGEKREVDEILIKYGLDEIYSSYVSILAFDLKSNNLAGFYGILPAKFKYEGNDYLCGQVCDLMTHSDYRRLGLFEAMANEAHSFLKESGFKFIFTIPFEGAISYFGFVNKLNFKEKLMNSYSLNVNTYPLSKKLNSGFLSSIYYFYLKVIFGLLIKTTSRTKFISIDSTKNYLIHERYFFKYKSLLSKINFYYESEHHQVFMKIDKDGALSIGSLLVSNLKQFDEIIKRFKIACFFGFIRYIHFEVCNSNQLNEFLNKKNDPKNLYTICYLNFDEAIDVNKVEFNFIDIDTF